MNKTELIKNVAEKTDATKAEVSRILDAFIEEIENAMSKKEVVQIPGFGTFQTADREARHGRNPRTGEAIEIAATTVPVFHAGKKMKESAKGC